MERNDLNKNCVLCPLRPSLVHMLTFAHTHFSHLLAHFPNTSCTHISESLLFLQLFDLVYREETLLNVIKSVTRNGRSIVLTAVLALILVYLFSIVGYIFFKDDFILAVDRIPNKTLGMLKYRSSHSLPRTNINDLPSLTQTAKRLKRECFSLVQTHTY